MTVKHPATHLRVRFALVMFSLLTLVVSGCSVKFISDYDEVTDKSATALHKNVERFLLKMEATAGSSAGTYRKNKTFYDEAKVALSSMRMRAKAIPNNRLTVQHIELLEKNIDALRTLHEKRGPKGLAKPLVDPVRDALDAQFTAIIKLELAKKRGE
ncbi:MAG: hypothetical protein ACE5IQ_09860 [Candidatus Methylomirabilales bacterium]